MQRTAGDVAACVAPYAALATVIGTIAHADAAKSENAVRS